MSEQTPQPEVQLSPGQILHNGVEFLRHFDVKIDPAGRREEFIEAMDQLNPRFQGDRPLVRFELESDQTQWPEETKDIIMRTAEKMRMLEPETPLVGQFDVVISLGAARQANLDRLRYAVAAAKGDAANVKQIIATGSARELHQAEQENTANYAPGAAIEFDLCAGAATAVAKENPGLSVSLVYVDDEKAHTATVVGQVLADLQARDILPEGASVAAVTTQIYQAATALDVASAAKRFGVAETFVAGNPSDPNIVAKRTPSTYLSEILRTLKAAALAQERDEEAERLERERLSDVAAEKRERKDGIVEGFDENGRGWSHGIWYEDWNDPGTHPE